jgi:RNA polymerase sigma factor (sigma-70 family)
MRTPVDVALVGAAREGDRRATADLLAAHLPLVYNVVGRALAGHPDVDDVVQETMLRAFQGLRNLREPERFRSWLIAIAVRQVQERERGRRTARTRLIPWDDAPDPPDPNADVAEETLSRPDLAAHRRTLDDAGRWLDADDRHLLALYRQEVAGTLTRADVAGALGVSTAHAAVRIQRMRTRLTNARTVLAAWRQEERCPGLAAAARGWDGRADPRRLKRLHRHVRDCAACAGAGRALPSTEWLLTGIGLLPLPLALTKAFPVAAGGTHAALGGAQAPVALALKGFPLKKAAVGVAVLVASGFATTVLIGPSTPDGARRIDAAPPPPAVTTAAPVPPPATAAPARTSTVHLAPSGSDDGDGSPERPYATLTKAVSVVAPGQTVVAHGGVYRVTTPVEIRISGTREQRITLTNAPANGPSSTRPVCRRRSGS